jgi:signal transduction histidine kinase
MPALPSDLRVGAASDRVEQVLDNLLGKAFAASPAASTIDVKARRVADHIELRLSEQGPGLSREEKARAFNASGTDAKAEAGADWDWPSCVASSSAMADRPS